MCTQGMSRRRFVGLVPGLALVAAGCSGEATGPVEVKWGREYCEYCGMIIDDPHFATQVRGGPGRKVFKFDDPGDAVLFLAKQGWADDAEFWVGDLETGKWLDGRKAFYVGGQHSPMGHGFGAVGVQRDGALDFAGLRAAVRAKGSTSRCEPSGQDTAMAGDPR